MIQEYEINTNTLALIAKSSTVTEIREISNSFLVEKSTKQIIDQSCRYFGSSYRGRSEGARQLLGSKYRLPIIIEESSEMVFFPLTSPRSPMCSWVSLKNIKSYYSSNGQTIIEFINGDTIVVDTLSPGGVDNQVLRASRLTNLIHTRKIA